MVVCDRTLGIVKPDAAPHIGTILDEIWQRGFELLRLKSMRLKKEEVVDFYKEDDETQPNIQ